MTRVSDKKSYDITVCISLLDLFPNYPSGVGLINRIERKKIKIPNTEELITEKVIKLFRLLRFSRKIINTFGMEILNEKLIYNQSDKNDLPSSMFQFVVKITGEIDKMDLLQKRYEKYLNSCF